jgi:hypothetical protein
MALKILFIGKGNARNSPDKACLSAPHSSNRNNSLTDKCAQNPSLATSLKIDGIQCNEAEQFLFHIHAHLDIIIDGQYFLVNPFTNVLSITVDNTIATNTC